MFCFPFRWIFTSSTRHILEFSKVGATAYATKCNTDKFRRCCNTLYQNWEMPILNPTTIRLQLERHIIKNNLNSFFLSTCRFQLISLHAPEAHIKRWVGKWHWVESNLVPSCNITYIKHIKCVSVLEENAKTLMHSGCYGYQNDIQNVFDIQRNMYWLYDLLSGYYYIPWSTPIE